MCLTFLKIHFSTKQYRSSWVSLCILSMVLLSLQVLPPEMPCWIIVEATPAPPTSNTFFDSVKLLGLALQGCPLANMENSLMPRLFFPVNEPALHCDVELLMKRRRAHVLLVLICDDHELLRGRKVVAARKHFDLTSGTSHVLRWFLDSSSIRGLEMQRPLLQCCPCVGITSTFASSRSALHMRKVPGVPC